ncbi:uncharacterized protein ELE39_003359 [Cryptosporidium sp. chipmunk genotype I]|uniref:uncharacterized protein n=1 Tax=Cryptosporidium sp. chipmunk genotype I TaxID=1280935 RepID=UPI003519E312|nr:hypothetical protein ELE39_003359 [Cryptosporidium sp. chipmunk genotype I]
MCQSRNNSNSTRRIVRLGNTNLSNSRSAFNSSNGSSKSRVIRGQGGRRVNTSFDNLNRRKLASSRSSTNRGFSLSQNARNRKGGIGRLNSSGSTGAIRRGGGGNGGRGRRFRGRNSGSRTSSRGRGGATGGFRGTGRLQKNKNSTSTASLVSYFLLKKFCEFPHAFFFKMG